MPENTEADFAVKEQPKKKRRVQYDQMKCSEPEADCLICGERLCNSSLAPAKLKRHLANHKEYQTKTKGYFERMCELTCKQKSSFNQIMKVIGGEADLLRASYRIAEVLCKQRRPFTEGEDVIKPSLIIAAEELHNEKAVKE